MDIRARHGLRPSTLLGTLTTCGINYFDTAKWDGDSEEKIGAALEDVRDHCIIATKTGSRTKKESLADCPGSLKRLRTDRIDMLQLHGIDDEKTLGKSHGS